LIYATEKLVALPYAERLSIAATAALVTAVAEAADQAMR
jgi:hypothetical protein